MDRGIIKSNEVRVEEKCFQHVIEELDFLSFIYNPKPVINTFKLGANCEKNVENYFKNREKQNSLAEKLSIKIHLKPPLTTTRENKTPFKP